MPVSPKVPLPDVPGVPALGSIALPSLDVIAKPAKLDFAANPNHYHASRNANLCQAKTKRPRGIDLSPRLVLELSLECETSQILDPDFGE